MCGRFSLIADLRELGERFGFDPGGLTHPPSITTTVRKKWTLSTSSWRPVHALDSFVALPSAKRFPAKN